MSDIRSDPYGMEPEPPLPDKQTQKAFVDADVAYQVLKDDVRLLKITQYRGSDATGKTVAEHEAELNPHPQYATTTSVPTATTLGLGNMAYQNSSAVSVGGGTLSGVTIISGLLTSTQSIGMAAASTVYWNNFVGGQNHIEGSSSYLTAVGKYYNGSYTEREGYISFGNATFAGTEINGFARTSVLSTHAYGTIQLGTTADSLIAGPCDVVIEANGNGNILLGGPNHGIGFDVIARQATSAGSGNYNWYVSGHNVIIGSNVAGSTATLTITNSATIILESTNISCTSAGSLSLANVPQTAANLKYLSFDYTRASTAYTSTGTSTHTFDAASKVFYAVLCGGGGGGGAGQTGTALNFGGGGGGSGAISYVFGKVTSSTASVTIGVGGAGEVAGVSNAVNGGDTTLALAGGSIVAEGGGRGGTPSSPNPGTGGRPGQSDYTIDDYIVIKAPGQNGGIGAVIAISTAGSFQVSNGLGGVGPMTYSSGLNGGFGGDGGPAGSNGSSGGRGVCIIYEA